MLVAEMVFRVYHRWSGGSRPRAMIHRADCSFAQNLQADQPAAEWLPPFPTFARALRAAQATNQRVEVCRVCARKGGMRA